MFSAPRYLEWARRFYGQVPFDLASSGIPQVTHSELGPLPALDAPAADIRLIAAIARYNDVAEAEVAPALGTTNALWLAYATLLAPGDEVLVEAPGYEPLWRIAEGVGAKVTRFERPQAEGFRLDPGRVAAQLTPRTRIVAVSNLHNPSGARSTDDELREIAAVAASRDAILLVDEVYAPFDALVDADGIWGQSSRKLAPNVVAASSLTKCFGLGHQRIGWLLASPSVAAAAHATILATAGHYPLEHANLAVHAFARLATLGARARARTGSKRLVVQRWAVGRPDLAWSAPSSGLFGFATRSSPEDLTARIEAAATGEGIIVGPGSFFGVPNGFRLSWSIAEEKLDEGLERLGGVLAR